MTRRSRRCLPLVAGAVLAALGAVAPVSVSGAPPTAPLAAAPLTVIGGPARTPAVSADGRLVVYAGDPAAPDGRTSTVYLLDRATATTIELTEPVDGLRPGNSVRPAISADGCHVVVVTEIPYDLFRDDDIGARWDVYQLTLPACAGTLGTWELISSRAEDTFASAAGDDADPDETPSISGSGSIVAYSRKFSAKAPEGVLGVAVVDRSVPLGQQGRTRSVAGSPTGVPDSTYRYAGLHQPTVSDDGRFIAFTADADAAARVPIWSTGAVAGGYATSQVYVWDRNAADPSTAVSAASVPAGGTATGAAGRPSISHDGRYVAFESTATDLVGGAVLPACSADGSCPPQVYRLDRSDGTADLVSRRPGAPGATPVAADAGGHDPAISFDGSVVTFVTRATNLFDVQAAPTLDAVGGEVVTAAVDAGTLARASSLADGASPAPLAQHEPRTSADGRTVVFQTTAATAFDPTAADPTQAHVVVATHPPKITVAPLDVGTVAVGAPSGTWFVSVANDGPIPFVPATITSSNPDFAVIAGGTCQLGVAVPAGGSCTVYVVLTPSTAGPKQGTLTVAESGFGATSATSQLRGGGGVGALAGLDAGHDFGSVRVGSYSPAFTLRVANSGLGGVNLAGVTVDGTNRTDFAVTGTTCAGVLGVGASCTVDVAFTPTLGGQRVANVRVSGDTGEYAAMVVAGAGAYSSAALVVATDRVVAGGRLGVGGAGFPANTPITLSWSDGFGGTYAVTTNKSGGFLASVVLASNERPGARTLIARTMAGPTASADVVVLPRSMSPGLPIAPG